MRTGKGGGKNCRRKVCSDFCLFEHYKTMMEGKTLSVHHKNYNNCGNEQREDIIVLCWDCHNKIHNNENDNKI